MKMTSRTEILQEVVERAAKRFGKTAQSDDRGRVYFDLGVFRIDFFHPERWSDDVSCIFAFSNEVSFFFEDVRDALERKENRAYSEGGHGPEFVSVVSDFVEDHFEALTLHFSEWFLSAAEASYHRFKVHFPKLAESELTQAKTFLSERSGHPIT